MTIALEIINEKNRILGAMKEEVSKCMLCPELCINREKTVFGEGNVNAKILFLGESAGKTEAEQGRPFVGKSGELLSNIIKSCGLKREELFICNILKCHPPNNRNPKPEEIANCYKYLEKQIAAVNPKYIVCLGSVASKTLIGLPVSQARGKWFKYKNHKVLAIYHPSYLLRKPSAKKEVWDDLQLLLLEIK